MLGTIPRFYRADLDAVLARFPMDVASAPVVWGQGRQARILDVQPGHAAGLGPGADTPVDLLAGARVGVGADLRSRVAAAGLVGRYVDEWGSGWEILEPGVVGEVKAPALVDWSALDSFAVPDEILAGLDLSPCDAFYRETDKFVIAHSTVQPFQRLIFLRGFENLMLDLGHERAELLQLLRLLHEYFMRELRLLVPVAADAIQFKDDWGSERGLLISPAQWRRLFKPLYAEYCRVIHQADKYAFFHSDGQISAIYPDLVEIGVDAVNSQLFCMDIEALAAQHKGKITFWGEIDRRLLAFGRPADVRAAVRRVRRALDDGRGGLIAQFEWGNDTPRENVEAAFEAWLEPAP